MRKRVVKFVLIAALLGGIAHPASADPSGPEHNPNAKPSENSNCVAQASAQHKHNGQAETLGQGGDPSHGKRGDEIKGFQQSC